MSVRLAALVILCALGTSSVRAAPGAAVSTASPLAAVDELLAADRAFSAAAADKDFISAVSSMLAPNAVMPSRVAGFSKSPDAIAATLRSYPDLADAKARWQPVRGGISADGLHGFTYGFMTLSRPGKPDERAKYLSYWVKGPDGWKVALFKRGRSAEGVVSTQLRDPALPPAIVPPRPGRVAEHRASLIAAEKAFSNDAQTLGVGPAFAKYGRSDAMNMGAGADFLFGNQAIGAEVGGPANSPEPTPIHWAADEGVLVASSGDLGVTWGWIRNHKPQAGQPDRVPFFTIWRRNSTSEPWRYVAE